MIKHKIGFGGWIKDSQRCALKPSPGQTLIEMQTEAIADGYVKSPMSAEYIQKYKSIPQQVSKLALAQAIFTDSGLRLMSLLTLVPVEMKDEVEEFLVLSQHIDRNHPSVEPLAALLGYNTPEKINDIFILADQITT
tara:strand:+ start:935 stop:1345 length:411 start_codon:yes stop_codon:yes gene_type:complete